MAQSTSPATDQPADIVVTAQRREQRLQDVGIAITALPGTELRQLNIANATDLTRAVPTLKMNAYSSAQVVFNIRGVSQNDYGDQQEPPVAVYQDDSYSSSINLASFPTFDLGRVEVLRGPQGTLFGRNATGGAVQFISNQPSKDFGGYASVTVGSYGQLITEGAITGPITDTLQFRLAGIRDRDKGYIENINPGMPARGANNHWALRGILAWQPTPTLSAKLTLRYMRAPKERQAGLYSLVASCPNAQFQGEVLAPNDSCAYWGSGPGETGAGYRNDAINPARGGDPYKTAATDPSYVDRKVFGATLRVEANLAAGLDLVSITDYQHGDKFYVEDGDSSPADGVFFYQGSKLDQGSEEVRLQAHLGANELTVGAYGLIVDGHYTGKYADLFYGYDPLVAFSQKTTSFAFFAQDEWKLSDKIKLIGGLRYWHDSRRGSYFGSEPSTGVSITFNPSQVSYGSFGVTQPSTGVLTTPANATPTFSGVTARAEIDYKPIDQVLLYASYNRGSKSGGFTFSTGTPFPGFEVATLNGIPYRPEVLDAYEIGAKTTLMPGTTLNVAAFYYDYHDYQAFAQYGAVQTVVNLPAKSEGIEAELATRPVRGLTLQLSGSVLHTEVHNVELPDLASFVTHNLPQAPGFSGNALVRYEFALAGGKASLQADFQHSDKFCFTVLCAPVEREGAYNVANARIGYAGPNDTWEIAAFVNNIFAEKYRVYGYDNTLFDGTVAGVYAKPRTWGVTGVVHFGAAR
ncbi:TonB-dependent receptor [Sphingomonas oligophenolica]|uniref:TonB-dependent receptor n=1 Tax=Sphingomonas oligophenolica TaxID=301154 RepID=A0ABU9YC36_9SPHN